MQFSPFSREQPPFLEMSPLLLFLEELLWLSLRAGGPGGFSMWL